jgi:streptogramin lyase
MFGKVFLMGAAVLLAGCGATQMAAPSGGVALDHAQAVAAPLRATWRPFPIRPYPGLLQYLVRTTDGNVWFPSSDSRGNDQKIGMMTSAGVVSYFPVASLTIARFNALGRGSDSHVTFAAELSDGGNAIGEIDQSGTVLSLRVLPNAVFLAGVGLPRDSSGNTFFSAFIGNPTAGVGRLSPRGNVTFFGCSWCTPAAIPGVVRTADGNIWFTYNETLPMGVGRMTPQGTFTNFPMPQSKVVLGPPIIGPDGNLWFSAFDRGDEIARVTRDGIYSFYPVPAPMSEVKALAAGLGRVIWFTSGAYVGRIKTDGTYLAPLQAPSPSAMLQGIAVDPNGDVWISNARPAQMLRLSVTQQNAAQR